MTELEKLNLDYTAKRLIMAQDARFADLQKQQAEINAKLLEYLQSQVQKFTK